jgi:outer membrane protein TolC
VVLKKLTQASVYKQTDYLTFYTTLQQQELSYLQAQVQYNDDYLTLNYLAGVFDTAVTRIEAPQLADGMQTDFYRSPFYTRFVTDSLRIANERALIRYQYQPRIGVYTDAGFNSTLQHQPYKNIGFSAGVSLSIPIYDGRRRTLQYGKLSIEEQRRQTSKDYFVAQHRQQIAQLRRNLQATVSLTQKIEQQITYTRTLIAANNKLLETGDITIRDYVLSINNYLAAQNGLTQNNITRLRTLNQLNYLNR